MNVLVTGASGFLGRHILASLTAEATHAVTGLCRRPIQITEPGVTAVGADLTQPGSLAGRFDGIDAVIHSAGSVSHDPRNARAMYEAHVLATEHVLAEARAAGVKRLVFVSTSGTVAVSAKPVVLDETAGSPLAVVAGWPYYRSKLFAEQAVLAAGGEGLDVVVLNPSLLLGPSSRGSTPSASAGDAVLLPLLRGELPMAPSGGVSFVDVRDVAAQCVRALRHGHPNRRYLLSSANWTFADFYGRAARIAGVRPPSLRAPSLGSKLLSFLPRAAHERLPAPSIELEMVGHTWWADSARAAAELGWVPREPLDTLSEAVLAAQHTLSGQLAG